MGFSNFNSLFIDEFLLLNPQKAILVNQTLSFTTISPVYLFITSSRQYITRCTLVGKVREGLKTTHTFFQLSTTLLA